MKDALICADIPSAHDQLLNSIELPHRAIFYPLGFPAEILSNCPAILEAAEQSWGLFKQRFDLPPLTVRLGVASNSESAPSLPLAPLCRIHGNLLVNLADAYNFVSCDLNTGLGFGWITERVLESTLYLRYHFLEAAVLALLAATHVSALHAACISSGEYGILLCGDSGAGKSSLAFAAARSGWTYTCDDASYLLLRHNESTIVGNCYQFRLRDSGTILFPEIEGRSVTPRATGKPSLEIPTGELPGIMVSEKATVRAIVFLNRHSGREELISYSKDHAIAWLKQSQLVETASSQYQRAAIESLAEQPIFELRYTRLDWAIERLNQLATQGC